LARSFPRKLSRVLVPILTEKREPNAVTLGRGGECNRFNLEHGYSLPSGTTSY
jgi:hypothetical protein